MSELQKFQLYDLEKDPSEKDNLFEQLPEKVDELTALMISYIENGRSSSGTKQANTPFHLNGNKWSQVHPILSHKMSK